MNIKGMNNNLLHNNIYSKIYKKKTRQKWHETGTDELTVLSASTDIIYVIKQMKYNNNKLHLNTILSLSRHKQSIEIYFFRGFRLKFLVFCYLYIYVKNGKSKLKNIEIGTKYDR